MKCLTLTAALAVAALADVYAAEVVVVSEAPESRRNGLRFEGVRAEVGAVNPVDGEIGPVAGIHASLGTMFLPWLDFTSGVRWWKADLDESALGGRSGDFRSLGLHGNWHAHLFRVKGTRPYVLTGVSVRHLSAQVDGDASLEDAISGFKAGVDLGAGLASTRKGLGWRLEARRELAEDAGAWSWSLGAGWWPRASARKPVRVAAPAAPAPYPAWTAAPVAPAPAPVRSQRSDLEPIVRKLLADNEALRARLDSLVAAHARLAEASSAPAPAEAPAPAPVTPDPGEGLRRLAALIGQGGTLVETADGGRIRLTRSAAFRSGGAEPGPGLREDLRKVALYAFRFPSVRFVVEGHTDAVGSAARNRELGESRGIAVRNELVRLGVDPDRIVATGMGSAVPIADNATPEGRALNRRVEIRVIRGAQGDNR